MAMLESEKELEDYLFSVLPFGGNEPAEIFKEYFGEYDVAIRQFSIGNYGIADIVCFVVGNNEIYATIYELKKESLNYKALYQIARYKKGLTNYLEEFYGDRHIYVNCVLVGKDVDTDGDLIYIIESLEWLDIFTFRISISSGIVFEHFNSNWGLVNEGFKQDQLDKIFKLSKKENCDE